MTARAKPTADVDAAILAAADWAAAVGEKQTDIHLRRTMTSVAASSNGATLNKNSSYGFIQQAQKSDAGVTTAGKITIKNPDGTTLGTFDITSDATSDPITSVA